MSPFRPARPWDVATGKNLETLPGQAGRVFAVAFLPGGQMLPVGSPEKTVRLRDTTTGKQLVASLRSNDRTRCPVLDPCHPDAFASNGRFVATILPQSRLYGRRQVPVQEGWLA
jgi:WD40 repeat protein